MMVGSLYLSWNCVRATRAKYPWIKALLFWSTKSVDLLWAVGSTKLAIHFIKFWLLAGVIVLPFPRGPVTTPPGNAPALNLSSESRCSSAVLGGRYVFVGSFNPFLSSSVNLKFWLPISILYYRNIKIFPDSRKCHVAEKQSQKLLRQHSQRRSATSGYRLIKLQRHF